MISFMMPRYDYLGRVDYSELTDKLLRELSEYGKQLTENPWIEDPEEISV